MLLKLLSSDGTRTRDRLITNALALIYWNNFTLIINVSYLSNI
jgi:hypothetical protein